MALKRLAIDGYGQLELNNVTFRRDGRIEAQCALDATDFADKPAENGMILAIDNITRTVKLPKDNTLPVALNYSTEHMYDDRAAALKDFATPLDSFYPRLGYLAVGEKFTTNTIAYDDTEFTDDEALVTALKDVKTTKLYGGTCENGAIKITKTAPAEGIQLLVVKYYTMPDGTPGVKFQVIKA